MKQSRLGVEINIFLVPSLKLLNSNYGANALKDEFFEGLLNQLDRLRPELSL